MTIKELKKLLENIDEDKKIVINLDDADTAILKNIKISISGDAAELILKTNIKHQHIYRV